MTKTSCVQPNKHGQVPLSPPPKISSDYSSIAHKEAIVYNFKNTSVITATGSVAGPIQSKCVGTLNHLDFTFLISFSEGN